MKQITAVLLVLLVIGIQPAFALKELSNEEMSKEKYLTTLPGVVSVAGPREDISNKYEEGDQQLKSDDKSYYQDLIKQREETKRSLEKNAIIFEVGESRDFFIRSKGREEQVQVTLTEIHERRESVFSSIAGPSSDVIIDDKPKKELKKDSYYCANFLIQMGNTQPPQPVPLPPPQPEQALPSIVTPPAPIGQPPLEKEVVTKEWKGIPEEGGEIPIGKGPPVPVKEDISPIYYANQELCLTPKDIGFIIEVYTIDREKQRVKFALNAEEISTGVDVIAMAQEDEQVSAAVKRTRTSITSISPEKGIRVKTAEDKEERKGCRVNGENIAVGTRFIEEQGEGGRAMYCTPSSEILPQKGAGEEAKNEYECISGKVEDGRCSSSLTFLQRILSLFGLY